MTRTRRDAFTLVELLVVIAIMGTLMSILLPAVQAVRESARKVTCSANLSQVVLAMQMYHDGHRAYPAGLDAPRKKLTGSGANNQYKVIDPWKGHTAWVHLLLHMEHKNLYDLYNFQLPSEDPENEPARSESIALFLCRSDESDRNVVMKDEDSESRGFSRSNYALCFGSETMGRIDENGNIVWKTDGAFRVGRARKERDFASYKGKTQTVVAAEVISGIKDDFDGGNSYDLRGVWAFYEMGSFAYTHSNLPNSEEPDAMKMSSGEKHCIDRQPAMPCEDGGKWYEYHAAARSRHPGGLFIAYADQRVEWINDNEFDLDTWRRMGSQAVKRRDEREDEEFKVRSIDRF